MAIKNTQMLVRLLGVLLILTLVLAAFSLASTVTVNAKQGPPDSHIDSIPLGCVCNYIGVWECCDEAYWHPENGGWLECVGRTSFENVLPYGCDPYGSEPFW